MNIIGRHIHRNIIAHKGRSFLIIFSLIVATAVLILNVTLGDEIATKYEQTLKSIYGKSDVLITMKEGKVANDIAVKELVKEKLDLGSIDKDTMLITSVEGYANINQKGMPALIMGMDLQAAYNMDTFCKNSIHLEDNQLVVNEKCAQEYNIHKGDSILFTYQNKEYKMEVVEIVVNYRLTALENEHPYFISNLQSANRILGYADQSGQELLVNVKENNNIKEFIRYIKEHNANTESRELVNRESIEDSLASITSLLTIILVIVVVMIFFVIGSLNKLVIAERFPVIGTFRSVGATKNKMNWILVGENAIYGLIGGLIGSAVGYIINSVVAKAFISTEGVELADEKAGIQWGIYLIGILFAVLLEVVISLKAILRANRKPIKDIIFNVQSTRYKISKKKSWLGALFILVAMVLQLTNYNSVFMSSLVAMALLLVGCAFLVPVWLRYLLKGITALSRKIGWKSGMVASKNISYSKTIISSATLMVVAIASILTVFNVSVSFSRLFESFRHNNDFDIIIQNVSNEYEEYSYVKNMEGVQDTKPLYFALSNKVMYGEDKTFTVPPLFLVAQKGNMQGVELDDTSFDIDSLKENEIIVDSFYAKRNHIKVGDTFTLTVDDNKLEQEFKVVGTANTAMFSSSRNVFVMNLGTYQKNITKIPTWIQVTIKEGVDVGKFIETLKGEIKEYSVHIKTFDQYIEEQEKQTAGIMSVFYVIIGLAVVLSFVGIVNNQIIGFIQRKREIAVLNSTCMSKGQIRRMLFTETLLTSILSGIIACIVVVPTVYMVNTAMEGLSMYISVGYNLGASIQFVGIVVFILLFTTLIPFRKIKKMNIVSEIKYE